MLTLRNATEADLDAMTRLWRVMMAVQLTLNAHFQLVDNAEEIFQTATLKKLAAANGLNLIAEKNRQVAGFCFSRIENYASIYVKDRYCLISDLSVDPELRRSGVAGQLLDRVEAWAAEQEVNQYEVNVAVGNEPAELFWLRRGFTGLTTKFIRDNGS